MAFRVPPPEGAELKDSRDYNLGNVAVKAYLYKTNQNSYAVAQYYQNFFRDNDFESVLDKQFERRQERILRFKKDNLIVGLVVKPAFPGTEVTIAKYLQPESGPSLEEQLSSLKNSPLFSIPKEDQSGEDLKFIPRPPRSIRWSSKSSERNSVLVYATDLPLEELKDFYRESMQDKGWQLANEMATQDAISGYKKLTGKDPNISGMDQLNDIVSDAENFKGVVSDSYVLDFRGPYGRAKVIMFPNFVDRKLGNIVNISYTAGE